MIPVGKEIIFSLSDFWNACKKRKREIFVCGLLSGILCFAFQLKKPLLYTAQGVFKGGDRPSPAPLSKALELLGGNESYSSQDDPKSFMRVYPVLEEVVKNLDLQATVIDNSSNIGFFTRYFRSLKTEAAYLGRKKPKAFSRIQASSAPLLLRPLFPDPAPALRCSHVLFSQELASVLFVQFEPGGCFKVFENNFFLGEGHLGSPFTWKGGSFTLEGKNAGKTCSIHFIPLEQVVKGLEKSIQVKRDKENTSLIHVHFTHPDRHLAAAIVNQTMLCFQTFLKKEGSKKISQQLDYLQIRQKKAQEELETILESQFAYLQNHLDSGEIITFEKELEYLANSQSQERKNLQKILSDIQALSGEKTIESVRLSQDQNSEALSTQAAHALLADYQCQLDHVHLEKERLEYCSHKLMEPDFDASSLSQILSDPTLISRFDKMHSLHRNLADTHNWSEKEKKQLKEELESEKHFLLKHVEHLKEGELIQENVLKERIASVQKTLLSLLVADYEACERHIQELARKAAHFPQKWLLEKKIDINMQLYSEMVESITKMIEAKNIGYHLEYLTATPLKMACSPPLPNSPRLLMGFLAGIAVGIFLALFLYAAHEIWEGPSASYENLLAYGCMVMGYFSRKSIMKERDQKTLRKTAHHIVNKGPVFLIGSQCLSSFPAALCSFLAKRGEKVAMIDFNPSPLTFAEHSVEHRPLEEEQIFSKRFTEQVAALSREFERVCFILKGSPSSLQIAELLPLMDAAVFCVTDERLKDLASLNKETLFLIHPQEDPSPFSLFHVRPLLEAVLKKLIPSSYASLSKKPFEEV